MLKINFLTIAGTGLLMLLAGLLLFVLQDSIGHYRRFFLAVPPLGVAAYVFVFNVFQHYDGRLPERPWQIVTEVLTGTAVAAGVFFVFSVLLVAAIDQIK